MAELDKKIFGVLYDPLHLAAHKEDDPRLIHVHIFNTRYKTDGSEVLIKADLDYFLREFKMNLPEAGSGFQRMKDAPAYSYCMNDAQGFMNSSFLVWFVTAELQNDTAAVKAFRTWIEKVVRSWATANGLKIEVKYDKPGEYWNKFVITIPIDLIIPT